MLQRLHTLAFEAGEHALAAGVGAGEADLDTGHDDPDIDADDQYTDEQAGFDYQSDEFQDAVGYATQQAVERMLQEAAQQGDGEEGFDIDPLAEPGDYQQAMLSLVRREIQQALGPILPTVETFQQSQSQEWIDGRIEGIPATKE